MVPFGGLIVSPQRIRQAKSLVYGVFALCLGSLWPLKGSASQVVLEAGRSSQPVMALVPPEVLGKVDPALGTSFMATARWDLAHSGVFRPLPAAYVPTEANGHLAMRRAGAQFLMMTRLTRGWTGRLVVHVEVTDLGSEARVFRKAIYGSERAVPRMAHHLVDELIGALTGTAGVAGSRLVFAHELGPGRREIFQVDPDGNNLVRITHQESLSISPAMTKRGRLAYVTYVGGLPHLWGQKKKGEPCTCLYPVRAGEGRMAFTPAWSPGGKHLAFVQPNRHGESDLALLNLENSKVRQLTENNGINTEPAWSPSGNQIAFTSDRAGTPQIYLMERDGSNVRRLTLEGTYNASPAWSPDGSMLAYVSRMDGLFNLFVYKMAEGKAYQVTRGMVSHESPAWSPDGRWLAFASDQDSKRQLYIVDTSGTLIRKVLDLPNCQSPVWTRSR
jgi:TolB protein